MVDTAPSSGLNEPLDRVLGYLNFSSGAYDPQVHAALNILSRTLGARSKEESTPPFLSGSADRTFGVWGLVVRLLRVRLQELRATKETFSQSTQAELILTLTEDFVPAYFAFHRDLLFHQSADDIVGPFMLGRILEVLLQQLGPNGETRAIIDRALKAINDFVGYRPVPTLEWGQVEVHPHEWIRPVPLYLPGVGTATGKYEAIVEQAVQILQGTDSEICAALAFDFGRMKELAFDPRAYDFDHPVNKRPNYHFGEWDPHSIDPKGNYCRFVVREVTLQALLSRILEETRQRIPQQDLIFEAAAVLAGTMLMASAISGSGPEAYGSEMTLAKLVPRVAEYRDRFYKQLFERVRGKHADRLRLEAKTLQQPFGGARQHLNAYLARLRCSQLEHVRLAKVFARMGYLSAAQRQADAVPVASARILCRIDCGLTAAYQALQHRELNSALQNIDRVVDLLHRGIDCGAIVDPWNILGFDAHFSLFPALENSVHDHRVDDLLRIVDRLLDVLARLWGDAAAADKPQITTAAQERFEKLAEWWNKFAVHEVSSVEADPPLESLRAARDVAQALAQSRIPQAKSASIGFWAPYVQGFQSPKPYGLVLENLLQRQEFGSAMAVLVHWLSRSQEVPLERRGASFHDLLVRWFRAVIEHLGVVTPTTSPSPFQPIPQTISGKQAWEWIRKVFDHLEANAEELWEVPQLQWRQGPRDGRAANRNVETSQGLDPTYDEEEDQEENLYQAAYEDVVYRDSTDDGIQGALFDPSLHQESDDAWEREVQKTQVRLLFLYTLARCWSESGIAIAQASIGSTPPEDMAGLRHHLEVWHDRARKNREDLIELASEIHAENPQPSGIGSEALARFDRQRILKDSLLEQVVLTCIKMAAAEVSLRAALTVIQNKAPLETGHPYSGTKDIETELEYTSALLACAILQDQKTAVQLATGFLEYLEDRPILYAPMNRGGKPGEVIAIRIRQQCIQDVLVALPRLGLIRWTLEFIETVRNMERNDIPRQGAVSQFDDMFEVGFRELVELLVRSTQPRADFMVAQDQDADTILIGCLEQITEDGLGIWLHHSQTLRLSTLERLRSPSAWRGILDFIQKYGSDLFTQDFLFLGNIRAILHWGTRNWLLSLKEELNPEDAPRLVRDLDQEIPLSLAAQKLELVLEAVAENYDEYRDYNSTTTQSDRGELLYILLDFLRLRAEYDRVAWNLRPVILSHRVLVRSGRTEAAQVWRRMLHDRLGTEADRYQKKLLRLQKKYAVSMGTVAQRIAERFLQPMTIDRMQALIGPAIEQLRQGNPGHAFEILEEEAELLMRVPLGSGIAAPKWLVALEDEIEEFDPMWESRDEFREEIPLPILARTLTWDELQQQLSEEPEDG